MKIHSSVEFLHDGRMDMAMLLGIFLEPFIANAPKKCSDFHLNFDYTLTCPPVQNMGEGVGHVTKSMEGD
jgi:hypothetical protein